MLERAMFILLWVLGWKRSVFTLNGKIATPFFIHRNATQPSYKALLYNLCHDLAEFVMHRPPFLTAPQNLEDYPYRHSRLELHIPLESIPVLRRMRAGGLLLTAHYGNYESMGLWLSRIGIPLVASFHPQKPAMLDRLLLKLRSLDSTPYAHVQSPRAILSSIHSGKLFALLADQDYRKNHPAYGTFLERPVHCNPLPIFLLKNNPGLPIFCCAIVSTGSQRVLLAQELKVESEASLYQEYHHWLESLIIRNPDCWYGWVHRRFRSAPTSQTINKGT